MEGSGRPVAHASASTPASSSPTHACLASVSRRRPVHASSAGKRSTAAEAAPLSTTCAPGWSTSFSKPEKIRFAVPAEVVLEYVVGEAHVTLVCPGAVAHIDDRRGTVTLVGPEDNVRALLDKLEASCFASGEPISPPAPRPSLPKLKEAGLATPGRTGTAVPTSYHSTAVPGAFSTAHRAAHACRTAGVPHFASRNVAGEAAALAGLPSQATGRPGALAAGREFKVRAAGQAVAHHSSPGAGGVTSSGVPASAFTPKVTRAASSAAQPSSATLNTYRVAHAAAPQPAHAGKPQGVTSSGPVNSGAGAAPRAPTTGEADRGAAGGKEGGAGGVRS